MSCRLRGTGDVGAYLSGGFDSGAVAATAARLLAPSGRRVIAFTGVPREGYDGPAPRNRIIDEGPYAAATAALYPNIEHVVVRNEGRSPLADLDRRFFLFDRPVRGICATGWANSYAERHTETEAEGRFGRGCRQFGAKLRWHGAAAGTVPQRTMVAPLAGGIGPCCSAADALARRLGQHVWSMVSASSLGLGSIKLRRRIRSGSRRLYGDPPPPS